MYKANTKRATANNISLLTKKKLEFKIACMLFNYVHENKIYIFNKFKKYCEKCYKI